MNHFLSFPIPKPIEVLDGIDKFVFFNPNDSKLTSILFIGNSSPVELITIDENVLLFSEFKL